MTEQSYRKYAVKMLRAVADRIEGGHYSSYSKSGKVQFGVKRIVQMVDFVSRVQIIPTAKKVKK